MPEAEDSKIFPQKLMEILNDPLNQEAICWLPHGQSFVVRNRKLFAETVMPRYFSRKAKYSSFTRKLNRWNFSRVSSGPEIGAYHHDYFRKDKPFLAATMFCKNARTMLAMASEPAVARGDTMAPIVKEDQQLARPSFEDLNSNTLSQLDHEEESFREQILQQQSRLASSSLRRGSSALMTGLGNPGLDTSSTNVRLLERQILLLQQQEETNRLLLKHAMMEKQQRDLFMSSFRRGVPSYSAGMQAPRKPTGNRASAA